jgi:hypothetical protein
MSQAQTFLGKEAGKQIKFVYTGYVRNLGRFKVLVVLLQ